MSEPGQLCELTAGSEYRQCNDYLSGKLLMVASAGQWLRLNLL
jgi:hypothetical protein